jgi:hypothetical protein
MLNSVFSRPGAKVLDVESFTYTVRQHSKLYSSAGLEHSFLFGEIDPTDSQPLPFRRWKVDAALVKEGIDWLFAEGD